MDREPIPQKLKPWTLNFFTIAMLALWLFPVYWIFLTSLKTEREINQEVPSFIFEPTLANYRDLFDRFNFAGVLMNSLIIVTATTIVVMILALMAAYALARLPVRGGKHIALWMLSLRFLPPIAVVIPFYLVWQRLNLLDTHLGLILIYVAFNLPFAVWMLRGFLVEVPRDLDEAAMLDGLSHLDIIRRIILPVVRPGAAVTAIFTFVFAWNEYLMALILTSRDASTVPVTISTFIMAYTVLWGDIGAAATIQLVPMLIVVFLLQKHIMRGITLGAVK